MGTLAKATIEARNLRKNQTNPEWVMWQVLRRKQVAGLKFRRQQPIGKYIVDFVSYETRLIIEIDGGQHNEEMNRRYDRERTQYLESIGYRVLRFWNNDVLENLDGVFEEIIQSLTPLSNSLPKGERIGKSEK